MSRGCSYCGIKGCNWETCPDRLEDYAQPTFAEQDGDDDPEEDHD